MTSAADFTRQQRFNLPKDFPVTGLSEHDQRTRAHRLHMAAIIVLGIAAIALSFAWAFAETDCQARGLMAGAENTFYDVRMSLAFRCVAKVDGKWIEVK